MQSISTYKIRIYNLYYIYVYIYFYVDVRGLVNKKHVQEGHEQVQQALMDYTLTYFPSVPVCIITKHFFILVKVG